MPLVPSRSAGTKRPFTSATLSRAPPETEVATLEPESPILTALASESGLGSAPLGGGTAGSERESDCSLKKRKSRKRSRNKNKGSQEPLPPVFVVPQKRVVDGTALAYAPGLSIATPGAPPSSVWAPNTGAGVGFGLAADRHAKGSRGGLRTNPWVLPGPAPWIDLPGYGQEVSAGAPPCVPRGTGGGVARHMTPLCVPQGAGGGVAGLMGPPCVPHGTGTSVHIGSAPTPHTPSGVRRRAGPRLDSAPSSTPASSTSRGTEASGTWSWSMPYPPNLQRHVNRDAPTAPGGVGAVPAPAPHVRVPGPMRDQRTGQGGGTTVSPTHSVAASLLGGPPLGAG